MKVQDSARGWRQVVLMIILGAIVALPATRGVGVLAQSPAVKFDVRAARGLVVTPVYEGWYEKDGTRYVVYGYYNRNLEEIVDIPIGPNNRIAPGAPDQGQPTRFFPGMFYAMFAVPLPKDQPKTEVTWTLTANGQTHSIPASLDELYLVSPLYETGGAHPGNTPPVVKFDAQGPSAQGPYGVTVTREATVARPLVLDVWATDDGLPPVAPGAKVPASVASLHLGAWGLALNWQGYRGTGPVRFSDRMPKVEQGKASTTVTFSEPGEYMLHLLAIDSRTPSRCCWTNGYVKVTVR
jgi:hypothetical protein